MQRPSSFLRTEKAGDLAAVWYQRDEEEIGATGNRCWLTVDTRFVPGLPPSGFLSLFTDEENLEDGHVEISASWPARRGKKLYAHQASVLPCLDAVFLHGSEAVGEWLRQTGWERDWGYNGNFKDKAVTGPYWQTLEKECPLYFDSDVFAVLGGWNTPLQCIELLDERPLILTLQESEPWVEAWLTRGGEFKVFQRIT